MPPNEIICTKSLWDDKNVIFFSPTALFNFHKRRNKELEPYIIADDEDKAQVTDDISDIFDAMGTMKC